MDGRSLTIRFESIGGLGADAAAQALACAAVLAMGLDAAQHSTRGLERKGAPVRSFVRVAAPGASLQASASADAPDAIVILHSPLLRHPRVFAGLRGNGTFIFPAPARFDAEVLAALPSTARAIRVDALAIATKEKSRAAVALLGTLCGAFDFLDGSKVLEAFCGAHSGEGEEALAAHRRAFQRGIAEFQVLDGGGDVQGDAPPWHERASGFDPRRPGGVVASPGNSVWNDHSASRTGFLPAFNRERCIHCAMCEMVCPDFCLVWDKGEDGGRFERELTGVDYRYCKGCMRCVETCPASAMLKKAETPSFAEQRGVPLFPDLAS